MAQQSTTMRHQEIVVYGADWCVDCRRAKRVLDRRRVSYRWIDIEQDPGAVEYILRVNNGRRTIPTILFPDGSILVEPSDEALERKLDAQA
jgi:mycoredoxin